MTDQQFEIAVATVRERIRIARDVVTRACVDVPWCTQEVKTAGSRALESLSELDELLSEHKHPQQQ